MFYGDTLHVSDVVSTCYSLYERSLLQVHLVRVDSRFFFNDTATTEIYTLSLHDALPILLFEAGRIAAVGSARDVIDAYQRLVSGSDIRPEDAATGSTNESVVRVSALTLQDRKSTRLNSSHSQISYAVFCLKKKKSNKHQT